jgi:hypothetical protein
MFGNYESYVNERKLTYKETLLTVVNAKTINPSDYRKFDFIGGSVPDKIQIENKIFTLNSLLFPSNYINNVTKSGIKDVAMLWLDQAKNATQTWKPIAVVDVVKEIEGNANSCLNSLISFSTIRGKGEVTKDFEYDFSFDDVNSYFTTSSAATLDTSLLSLFAYLLMLLPWLYAKRHPKCTGASTTADYEVVL